MVKSLHIQLQVNIKSLIYSTDTIISSSSFANMHKNESYMFMFRKQYDPPWYQNIQGVFSSLILNFSLTGM